MKRQFFSGNTLEQAVMMAARHFGLEPDRVAYNVREKKHGFLKVRRRVVIEVDTTAPERTPEPVPPATQAPPAAVSADPPSAEMEREVEEPLRSVATSAREPQEDSEPRFERPAMSESASVERAVRELLRFMDIEGEVTVARRSDVFEIEISDVEEDFPDREGRVLQAMEYLVPRVVRSWMGQGVPVKIDCDGFRAEREQELRELALDVANEVA